MRKKGTLILAAILLVASFLRLWKLSEVPVSLFGDELDVGYHAYSILKTGEDYSGNPWPLHFQSLAEWRTPLYLYSAVPTVALFGISPLGVRLPAAIFGILGVLGIYLLVNELMSCGLQVTGSEKLTRNTPMPNRIMALTASLVLALSPWHIQYSRGAFEVTLLLLLLVLGLYFFFKALGDDRFLWISVALLTLTPWVYSTAKLFTPLLLLFLFIIWKDKILKFSKRQLLKGAVAGLVIGVPIAYSTVFGGGTERANYLSVFTDPTIETEVGTNRLRDARMRGEEGSGISPKISDRLFHNKITFWTKRITSNYLQAFSTDFLFINGDPNLRHSINGMGEFYKIEALALILGLCLFFVRYKDHKIKAFIAFWLIAGVIPSAITRDGGNHATRLILVLPPLTFLIAYGLTEAMRLLKSRWRIIFLSGYLGLFIPSFILYQHNYWVHYPWDSERWWHAGFKESIQYIKSVNNQWDKIIISMSGEPAWIFFAGWYQYPPDKWHQGFPFKKTDVSGFGNISYIDKFYFGTFTSDKGGIYDLPNYLDKRTLYLATAKEIGANLIMEPQRSPPALRFVKAIPYPSGEPAFYLFAGTK